MKKLSLFISFVFSLSICTAQTTAVTQTLNLSLTNIISLTFVSSGTSTGGTITLPFSSTSDYDNGVISSDQQLTVLSNMHFNVAVQSNAVNFSYSGTVTPAPTIQVANVLQMMVSANNTGGSLSYSSYASIPSGTATIINWGSPGGNQTFSVRYKATPGYTMPSGTYTTNIIYTATQL